MSGEQLPFSHYQEPHHLLAALRESEILRELAELLASSLDLDRILQVLAKRTTEVCEVERCSVWLLEDARGAFHPAAYHLSSQHLNSEAIQAGDQVWYRTQLPFDHPIIHRLFNENGILFLEDLRAESSIHFVAETFLIRSILLVALIREGRPVGMLTLDDPDKIRTFSSEQQQLVRAIGQQAAIAIDNAQLYRQAQKERRRAEQLIERARAIYQVAIAVNSGQDLPTVLEIATHHLVEGLNADGGSIALLENETLHLASSSERQQDLLTTQITAALADLPNCYHAAQAGTPIFVTAEQAEGEEITWFHKLGLNNTIIVPLMIGATPNNAQATGAADSSAASRCVGLAFVNYHNNNFHPSKSHFAFAQDIAAQCALAVEKARLLATNHLSAFLQRYPTYTLHGQQITEEDFPLARALRGERIRAERFVTIRADGAERIVEMNVAPMHDSMRKQIGVVSAFHDITEQIRVEQRIRQALDTLLHVAEAVSGLTDIKDILHIVLERTLLTLNCERGVVQLYDEEHHQFTQPFSAGFSPEAEQQWLNDQRIWLQHVSDQYHGIEAQLMEGHATLINAEQYPHQPNLFNHLMILAAPIMHDNRLHGLIALDRSRAPHKDATEEQWQPHNEFTVWDLAVIEGIAQLAGLAVDQAHWQQEAIDARAGEAAMREANALKDEFLAITAHEFRTPLTVVLAQSQMVARILKRFKEPTQDNLHTRVPQMMENLSIIEEQAHHLTNIVATFLEVSIEPGEHAYLVMGDSARLQQIIANLVENAIKYSPLGGPVTIRLYPCSKKEGSETIEVCVEDQGIGVPSDAQPRLFERFYRAPNITIDGSKTRGVGLGLYIVAQLLQMHGGSIRVESSGILGEGSRFIFTLPALVKV